jgi:hypothetical protein
LEARANPFEAGPYRSIQRSIGLIGVDTSRAGRRAGVATLIAWLPLVVITAIEGHAIGPTPRESMWLDFAAHARYLVALPLLIIAESICLPGLALIAHHFGDAGLIPDESRPQYDELLESTRRVLSSQQMDIGILLVAYILSLTFPSPLYPADTATWVRPVPFEEVSLAGWWRTLVSQPLYLMLLLGWISRIVMWSRFLYGVSRLKLDLDPAHPDHAAGLGFVGGSVSAFVALAFTLPIPIVGVVAQEIFYGNSNIMQFRFAIASVVIIEGLIFTAPLLVLSPTLLRERRKGVFQYGALASAAGRVFEQRWLKGASGKGADILAVPDASAAIDLYSIAGNAVQMRLVPVTPRQLARLLVAAFLPFVPILAMTLPLRDIFTSLAKLIL